jgi:hypothetical protein
MVMSGASDLGMVNRWYHLCTIPDHIEAPTFKILCLLDVPLKLKSSTPMSIEADDVKRSDAARSFPIQDVLWAIGILAVIFGLTPVIAFYLLMAN